MDKKLQNYLDEAFAPYGDFPAQTEVKQELFSNLQEKYKDLKSQGKSDDEAYEATVESVGDISEIMEHVPHDGSKEHHRPSESASFTSNRKFHSESVAQADLAGTSLQFADFRSSDLKDSSFDGSDLSGASFKSTSLKNASFVGANLTDTSFSSADLQNASLDDANLTRAKFHSSTIKGAKVAGAVLVGVKFTRSDTGEVSFDGQTLRGCHL